MHRDVGGENLSLMWDHARLFMGMAFGRFTPVCFCMSGHMVILPRILINECKGHRNLQEGDIENHTVFWAEVHFLFMTL